jgi:flavin-dependent dehydrogenase
VLTLLLLLPHGGMGADAALEAGRLAADVIVPSGDSQHQSIPLSSS